VADLQIDASLLRTPDEHVPTDAGGRCLTEAASRLATPAPASGSDCGNLASDGVCDIRESGERALPARWINAIANPEASLCFTERGGGVSSAENSDVFRLSPWHNDPECCMRRRAQSPGARRRWSGQRRYRPGAAHEFCRLVLDERILFFETRPRAPDHNGALARLTVSDDVDTLLAHCIRVLDRACTAGEHGLPMIGGGDCNSGLTHLRVNGRGESVWLGWLLILKVRRATDHAEVRHEAATAKRLRQHAARTTRHTR
jgi:cellobiose phosphorylase